jgi:GT2 family glycosyltransferase
MKLSILVVNWNSERYLFGCIASIYKFTDRNFFEIIVIDNASTDNSIKMVRNTFPDVIVIENNQNLGFAAGNNLGAKVATGEYLLFLNPDTLLQNNAIESLVKYLENNPDVGIVAPTLINQSGNVQGGDAGYFPTPQVMFNHAFFLNSIFQGFLRGIWIPRRRKIGHETMVDWVSGASMLIRSSLFKKVGLFSTDYFMYAEDIDICKKVKEKKWKIVYLREVRVIHFYGKSGEFLSPHFSSTEGIKSLNIYYKKYLNSMQLILIRLWSLIGYINRAMIYLLFKLFCKSNSEYLFQKSIWQNLLLSFSYLLLGTDFLAKKYTSKR